MHTLAGIVEDIHVASHRIHNNTHSPQIAVNIASDKIYYYTIVLQ